MSDYITIELTKEQISALEPLFAKLDADHELFPGSIVAQVYSDHIRVAHIDHPTGLAIRDALSKHGVPGAGGMNDRRGPQRMGDAWYRSLEKNIGVRPAENLQGLFDEFESARFGVHALHEARLIAITPWEKASIDRSMRETLTAMNDCGHALMDALSRSIESTRAAA